MVAQHVGRLRCPGHARTRAALGIFVTVPSSINIIEKMNGGAPPHFTLRALAAVGALYCPCGGCGGAAVTHTQALRKCKVTRQFIGIVATTMTMLGVRRLQLLATKHPADIARGAISRFKCLPVDPQSQPLDHNH